MLIVGYVFAIRSERRICAEVQVNLAYRWFCKLGIEDPLPSERQAGDPPRVGKEGVRRPWARHARSLDHAIAAACIHGVCGFRRIALAAASAPCRARYGIPDARPRPGRPRPSSGPSSSRPHSR
jgi:hypothetical protein